ncbi:cytochrome P450 3A41-like [Physella acuta]|uniref:cytochrome P450 3A41-like n=1 Tax=Physella acuta TaxID=109671 RepID=UPI0027DE363C|nr:cytochrome P450 3A41-like [Physella acuta]
MFDLSQVPTWLALAATCVLLYVYLMSSTHNTFRKLGIPGPRPLPVLGNTLYTFRHGLFDTVIRGYRHFKKQKCYGVFEGRTPILTVTDLDMLQEIMVKKSGHFINRRQYASLNQPRVDSIMFNATGEQWKQYRSLLKPALNPARLKAVCPSTLHLLENVCSVFKEKSCNGEDVELSEVLGCFCMDLIAQLGFDLECDSLRNPNHEFVQKARHILNEFGPRTFIFEFFAPSILKRVLDFFGILILPKKDILFLRDFTRRVLELRKSRKNNPADFLQYMIDNSELSDTAKSSRKFTIEEMYGSSLTLILAGYDTSAKGFYHALYLLAMNPKCFAHAQKEVDEVLQGEAPNTSNIQGLHYLDMCIKESNRLYPLGYFVERRCNKETTIHGLRIPAGMVIRIPTAGIHRDPEIYPDPDTYEPERFTPGQTGARHPMAYIPFGAGPRSCFGEPLALMVIRMGMAKILQEFNIRSCDKSVYPIRLKPMDDIIADHGFWVNVTPRKLDNHKSCN